MAEFSSTARSNSFKRFLVLPQRFEEQRHIVRVDVLGLAPVLELFQNFARLGLAAVAGETGGFQRAQPGNIRIHHAHETVLGEGFIRPAGIFEGLRAKSASQQQVGMKLERLLHTIRGRIKFAAAKSHDHFGGGPERPKRIDCARLVDHIERVVQTVHRYV